MNPARNLHELFNEFTALNNGVRWRDWKMQQQKAMVEFYVGLGWKLIPIGVRAKRPLASQSNYLSRGALGPYLDVEGALYWAWNDFNLAVPAGPSKLLWLDIDTPELFREELLSGLVMRTPRGFGVPLIPDKGMRRDKTINALHKLGYDFRADLLYELVPLSVTCLKDHGLHGVSHPSPRGPCVDDKPHDYRVREWITPLGHPVLNFSEAAKVLLA